ncbi:hypothetical protein VTK73DRAFT_4472 [Phialemonium thermophilum]|uniref:FAD-binding domain-containing protein n=1 Tax=Phialemonium thermophilum TaxID=223376 RepID=A0ABR3V9D7_9PEZI
MPLNKVLIVGAGPSGLLLALLLAKAGVPVELLEMAHALDTRPRASHYSEPSCHEFERAGVLDAIRAEGFFPNGVSWRKLDEAKTRIVKLKTYEDHHDAHAAAEGGGGGGGGGGAGGADPDEAERYRMVCLPLHRLGRILEAAVREQPAAVIRYGHKVVDVGEDEANGRAWVKVEVRADGDDGPEAERETETETKTKTLTFTADYVVGCDGATSRVRQALFGRDVFPGYTWKEQIVATDMYYDFAPYDYDDSHGTACTG